MDPSDGVVPKDPVRPARQLLRDLQNRWGIVTEDIATWKTAPVMIRVRTMDSMETWTKMEHPSEPAKTVLLTVYELTDKARLPDGPT